jgi:uncharacterized protein YcfJ
LVQEVDMKKIVFTAVAATMFAAPAMARPPAHAPAHGWRAQQYAQSYQAPRYYNDGRAYYGQQRAYNDGVCRKDSNTGGTVIGALGGGIVGRELDKRKYSCR